ncbi:hypothetical protein Pgy4_40155, partial [Pseudomonas savastanoi pv. glycinea str. race 4]
PLALLRRQLAAKRFRSSQDLLSLENDRTLSVAGLVTCWP